jgi:regulatory protein
MEETVYRVTALERQKHRPDRVSVYLDGAFAFGLDDEVMLRNPIHEGDELSESFIDEVLLSDEYVRAKAKALRLLSHRALTTEELKVKLRDRDFSDRTSERVVCDLLRVGLLNDETFGVSYVRSRLIQRPSSKFLLLQELKRKGIVEEDARRFVDEAYGPQNEEEVAEALFRKKLTSLKGEDPKKARKKAVEFLFRRGFDWELIRGAMGRADEGEVVEE